MKTYFNLDVFIRRSVVAFGLNGILLANSLLGAIGILILPTNTYAQVQTENNKPPELTGDASWVLFSHGQDPRCDWSKCQRGGTDGSEFLEGRFSFYLMYRCKQNGKYISYENEKEVCSQIKRPIPPFHDCDARCYSEGIYVEWGQDTSATLNYLVDGDFGCTEKVVNSLGCFKSVGACLDRIKHDSPWSLLASEAFVGESCNVVGYKWGKLAKDDIDNKRKYTGSFCFEPEKMKTPVQFFHDCGYSEKPAIAKTETIPAGLVKMNKIDERGFGDYVARVRKIREMFEKGKLDTLESDKPLTGTWEIFLEGQPKSIWGREVVVLNARRDTMYGYAFAERPIVAKPDKMLPKKLEAFRAMEVSGVVSVMEGVTGPGGASIRLLSLVKDFPQLGSPGRAQICLLAEEGTDEFRGRCESITSGKSGALLNRVAQVRMKRLNNTAGSPKVK